MDSYREQIDEYLIMLSGPDAEDAWHSLREMGPSALPCMIEAFASVRRQTRENGATKLCNKSPTNPEPNEFQRKYLRRALAKFRTIDHMPDSAGFIGENVLSWCTM